MAQQKAEASMGSEETRKVSVLVYRHRHGEDITVYETRDAANAAAVAIVVETLHELPLLGERQAISKMIAADALAEDIIEAWHAAQSDGERIDISEDVNVQGDPTPAEASKLAEVDPEKAGDTLVRIWKMCEESGDSNTTLAEISRILAELDSAPTGLRGALGAQDNGDIFDDVIKAMQNAEEMGGPEGQKYIALMERIAVEATKRAANYRARFEIRLRPMCPKCTSMGTDDIEIKETYSAYHPVVEVDEDGKLAVRNALATGCPSEHFDDGKSDFVAFCRSCLHEGTPQSFGLGDPSEWEWV